LVESHEHAYEHEHALMHRCCEVSEECHA